MDTKQIPEALALYTVILIAGAVTSRHQPTVGVIITLIGFAGLASFALSLSKHTGFSR